MQIKYNHRNIRRINNQVQLALVDTAEALKTDLVQSQTMPFGKTRYKTVYGKRGKYAKKWQKI